jgi:geranylgeranyl diphosphate synthase type 3
MISAFNHWFKVSDEKLNIIDEIIDMLHNASLLIDDIEDGSDLRRSSPAAHIIYGIPLTINAAELTCVLSIQKAFALNDSRAERIVIGKISFFYVS